jgi:predicted nucleotidyltransferase
MARGDDREGSDVDILVTFDGKAYFDRFMGLKLDLEDMLGRPVDLGTPESRTRRCVTLRYLPIDSAVGGRVGLARQNGRANVH